MPLSPAGYCSSSTKRPIELDVLSAFRFWQAARGQAHSHSTYGGGCPVGYCLAGKYFVAVGHPPVPTSPEFEDAGQIRRLSGSRRVDPQNTQIKRLEACIAASSDLHEYPSPE